MDKRGGGMGTNSLFSVAGKRVLLTGAAGGIGLALARGFLDAGAFVAGVCRAESADLKLLRENTGRFFPLPCDLRRAEAVGNLPEQAEEALSGRLEVVIHSAWALPGAAAYSLENLRETMAVGLEAAFILYGGIAPRMAASGGGGIISIASINGIQAFPANPAYTAIKAGLRLFTKTIARDFGEKGVRANNLCPGYVHTRMTAASHADAQRHEERRSRTMLGRWAMPEDMVGPCIFLASDAAGYITGIDLPVDGGWVSKGV
jgi:NAD(P)-dependent dehydrogenase (short-subunit alcohol dehydrogenase family)